MTMTGLEADTQAAYRNFATREARGNSPFYEEVCLLIADDRQLVAAIRALPDAKRQPNLVLGAARYLGAPEASATEFVAWIAANWDAVVGIVMTRATQTNGVGRCATLLPFIAEFAQRVDGPIALIEVGCSAGLALYPDLYSYRYLDVERGSVSDEVQRGSLQCRDVGADSPGVDSACVGVSGADATGDHSAGTDAPGAGGPVLHCTVDATTRETVADVVMPTVAWRGGLDLNPLDVTSDTDEARDNARWLEALVWPGQGERRDRLRAAIDVARQDAARHGAPTVVAGDVVDDLDAMLAQVPDDLPLALFHSAVLAYTDEATRIAFEERMARLAARPAGFTWISNEAPSVMPGVAARVRTLQVGGGAPSDLTGRFVVAVDGEPRAVVGPHGQSLSLIPGNGRLAPVSAEA